MAGSNTNGRNYTIRKGEERNPYPGVIIEEMLDSASMHNGDYPVALIEDQPETKEPEVMLLRLTLWLLWIFLNDEYFLHFQFFSQFVFKAEKQTLVPDFFTRKAKFYENPIAIFSTISLVTLIGFCKQTKTAKSKKKRYCRFSK